jgi:uncharacterized SAM-binding protein YcdF (DUF218 family)
MLELNEVGDSTFVEWGDPDRFFGGIALFKAGKAQKLIFTGGKMPWDKSKKTEGEVLKEFAISNGIPSKKILVTKGVENTADEAVAVKDLIKSIDKIILVTSPFHMYRAKRRFERLGIKVIPYKVDYRVSRNSKLTIMDIMPTVNFVEKTEIGLRELLGRLFYLIND